MENLIAALTAAILALMPHWQSRAEQDRAREYATIIIEESQAASPPVDPFLVASIIFRESSFRQQARGKRGEIGLMQVMPRGVVTRAVSTEKITSVRTNIRVGIGHLNYWQQQCGVENVPLWLSAYNAGRCELTKYHSRVMRVYCRIKPDGCGGGVS
ncbi:MAG: transglycosylase SLT domain-containing protein [Myxococcota bacterium]|jgi:soluble lytic murein transglycosylase-like protein|nr:transglycosylase SLT domain-containing protein [Myxococcota bacterium]